jgi:hypothetical protein
MTAAVTSRVSRVLAVVAVTGNFDNHDNLYAYSRDTRSLTTTHSEEARS